jgi:spore maturation protein CgeB
MRIALFYHSLISDWNHGNAHFLRGIVSELLSRGDEVRVYEPLDSWSLRNLVAEHGEKPIRKFRAVYRGLESVRYDLRRLDLDRALEGVDLVVAHEWNDPELVRRLGKHRARRRDFRLLFHDTHHRMATDRESMDRFELEHFDGVLAYGKALRDLYLETGRAGRAWTWHEGADVRIFQRKNGEERVGDFVWIGNWGDGERGAEIEEFLIRPVGSLRLKATVYGVRYPGEARAALAGAGIEYGGWLPNFEAPRVFAGHRVTVHIPRRPYVERLPGIPTIRMFEALACGIALICSPWEDAEGLFRAGRDYLVARDGKEMGRMMRCVLEEKGMGEDLARSGLETIRARHTCGHRVDELAGIMAELNERRA